MKDKSYRVMVFSLLLISVLIFSYDFYDKSKWNCYVTLVEEIRTCNQIEIENNLTGKITTFKIDSDMFDDVVFSSGLEKEFLSHKEYSEYIIRFYAGNEVLANGTILFVENLSDSPSLNISKLDDNFVCIKIKRSNTLINCNAYSYMNDNFFELLD